MTVEQVYQASLKELLGVEGSFADHPADPGGATRFGITEAVARAHGYKGSMRELPVETAKRIYRVSYWNKVDGDYLAGLYPELAFEVFEFGVNAGTRRAYTVMQQVLNAANRGGADWRDLVEDGMPGPNSRAALQALKRKRGMDGLKMLAHGVDSRQFDHYFRLVRSNPQRWENFFYGWVANRVGTNIV